MAIALKLDTTTGLLAQLGTSDALDINVISQRTAGADMTIGANLGSGDELQLGKAGELVRVMGDLTVDGSEIVSTNETVTGTFTANGDVNLGSGDDTINIGQGGGDTVNLKENLVVGAGLVSIGSSVTDYLSALWLVAVNDNGPDADAYNLAASGTNCGAYAIGINPDLLANVTATDLMTALDQLDAAITAAGADTLQTAYEAGNTISVTSAEGSVALSNNTASDTTTILDINKSPGSSTGGIAAQITTGANATGTALEIDNGGSGYALDVQDGSASVLVVNGSGGIVMTPTSGQDLDITTAGAGKLDVSAAGGIDLDASAASHFTVAGAGLTLSTTTSGTLALSSAGLLDVDATSIEIDSSGAIAIESSGGAISIGADAVAQNVNIGTGGARTVTIGNASATEVQIDAVLVDINAGASGFTLDGGAASSIATSAGNLSLDSAAGELVFDDVGNSGITLSQTGDRTLENTGTGEVFDGITSIIGALNALADATAIGTLQEIAIENGVTISAGECVAQSTTSGRVTQWNGNNNTNSRFVGICITGGTGDAGGTVLCRFALPGSLVAVSGASFTAGAALFGPDGTGIPVAIGSAPSGAGDAFKRLGWAHTATLMFLDPGPTVIRG
jgi:hypothetical protein